MRQSACLVFNPNMVDNSMPSLGQASDYLMASTLDYISLCIDYPIESCKISVIRCGSVLPGLGGHWRGFDGRGRGVAHPLSH